MTLALSDAELRQRAAAVRARVGGHVGAPSPPPLPQHVRPLTESAESLIEVLDNSNERFMLGLPDIDVLTRGFGEKELVLIVGFTHSGKTQLVLTSILRNLNKRILLLSMDDSTEMVLTNLMCMHLDMGAEDLEYQVRNNSAFAEKVREQTRSTFKNLLIVDTPLRVGQLDQVVHEAHDLWGVPPDMVAIDYLQSMQGVAGDDTVRSVVQAVKRWVKDKPFPTLLLHQGTRHAAGRGEPITMNSGAFAGEQEASVIIGVRRQKFREDEDFGEYDRREHAETVTLHIPKNKRPPSRLTPREGIDFHMAAKNGLITPLRYAAVEEPPQEELL